MTKKKNLSTGREFDKNERALRTEAFDVFRRHALLKSFPAGRELFRQGDEFREVYLIESGLVRMTRTEINGNERPIEFRAPGRILGAAAVFSGNPALMTATALSRCEVYYLPVASFRRLAVSNPALAEYLLGTLSQQFCELVVHHSQVKSLPSRARIAALLLHCIPGAEQGKTKDLRLELPDQHQELAKYLLMTPEHFSRMLRELEAEGIIRREKGWIIVVNPGRLAQAAGSSSQAEHLT